MSVHVWSWVLKHSPAGDRAVGSSPLDRLVLLVLADHAHGDGTGAHPDPDTIARESRGKKRSVYYALDALEASGCIEQTGVTEKGVKEWRVLMTPAAANAKFAQRPVRKPQHRPVQTTTDTAANFAQPSANGDGHAGASINRPVNRPGSVLEPPSRDAPARTHEAHLSAGEGGNGHHPIVVPRGATPREAARLQRTAERLGARLVHEATSTNGGHP